MLRKLSLVFRFYRTSMLVPCVAVSVALAWLVGKWGSFIAPWCFFGKVAFTGLFLYVWVLPRYANEFYYYLALGIRRNRLLGVCCAADLAIYLLLTGFAASVLDGLC